MKSLRILFVLLFALTAVLSAGAAEPPKNIILLIADGWGYEQIAATNYFGRGESGVQTYERLFTALAMSTYSVNGHGYDPDAAWADFDYHRHGATDSAAAGTALATGQRTTDGAIGMTPEGQPIENIMERAQRHGKKTGVLTSVQFSHATPAAFAAHNVSRGNYEEIAREILFEGQLDVIMGAGHPWYDNSGRFIAETDEEGRITTSGSYRFVGGPEAWLRVLSGNAGADNTGDGTPNPWTLVQSREEFLDVIANPPARVFGLAQAATTLQQGRASTREDVRDERPGDTPLNDNVPTLPEMTAAALSVLQTGENGFVMMIEGGAIDWTGHANQLGRLIEEMNDFNATLDTIVAWVEANSSWDETLVVVTGDHETGYLTGEEGVAAPVGNRGKGNMPQAAYNSGDHTNSLIPVFVKGPGTQRFVDAANQTDPRRGPYLDITEVGGMLFEFAGAE